jgi:hypothetical protein
VHEVSDDAQPGDAHKSFPGVVSKAVRVNVLSLFNRRSCVAQQLRGSLSVWMDFHSHPRFSVTNLSMRLEQCPTYT